MFLTRVATILFALVSLWQETPKPATPAPLPIVPVAAGTLAANPASYMGSKVSVTAPVREALGATAFTIGQDPPAHDVLVLAPRLTSPVQPRAYVTVIGEVIAFDPATVASRMKDAAPALSAEVAAKYAGRATLIASSVITASMTDLARRPMLPGEEALSKTMKQVGPAFNALRAADPSKPDAAAANAATLVKAFADIEPFWTMHARTDAVQWAEQARKEADALSVAVKNGKWDEAKAAASRLQPICQNCHNAYRERLDDGTYRLKGVSNQ